MLNTALQSQLLTHSVNWGITLRVGLPCNIHDNIVVIVGRLECCLRQYCALVVVVHTCVRLLRSAWCRQLWLCALVVRIMLIITYSTCYSSCYLLAPSLHFTTTVLVAVVVTFCVSHCLPFWPTHLISSLRPALHCLLSSCVTLPYTALHALHCSTLHMLYTLYTALHISSHLFPLHCTHFCCISPRTRTFIYQCVFCICIIRTSCCTILWLHNIVSYFVCLCCSVCFVMCYVYTAWPS